MQDEFEGKRRVFAADHLKQNRADGFPGQKQVAGVRRFIVLIKFGIDAPVDFIGNGAGNRSLLQQKGIKAILCQKLRHKMLHFKNLKSGHIINPPFRGRFVLLRGFL